MRLQGRFGNMEWIYRKQFYRAQLVSLLKSLSLSARVSVLESLSPQLVSLCSNHSLLSSFLCAQVTLYFPKSKAAQFTSNRRLLNSKLNSSVKRKKASGESPNAWEVFQKIKCRNGVPVDEQSKQIKDRMDARIKQLTDEGVAYDINEVFGEVNAKTKKQRVVGLGSAASSFCIAPSGPSGESSGQSTRQVTEEIQQLKENLNIKDEEIRRLKEEQESMKEQFNEKLAEVFRRLDGTNEC
ncbi:hypothetical protein POM88_002619 [Heracleum sosnowskyi]|uniref:Transposase n=1 Tax=Heracleum sosnowskyi TaxID=360622 RepID=A0AAD8JF23_9APIA|nr:hypothetical protein POM88_002619 [Heracleum sosnowskyi]